MNKETMKGRQRKTNQTKTKEGEMSRQLSEVVTNDWPIIIIMVVNLRFVAVVLWG